MKAKLERAPAPELIFGLVAPIGVDLNLVTEILGEALDDMKYQVHTLRLTKLMQEINVDLSLAESPYIKSFKDRIAYANKIREKLGDEALAALAISAIRSFRDDWHKEKSTKDDPRGKKAEEVPVPGQAYIIRQFKRPEEVALMRTVYGKQFILVSAFAPEDIRIRRIEEAERRSTNGAISVIDAHKAAFELVAQDAKEYNNEHGQSVSDAFPLGDVFIDTTNKKNCEETVQRFIKLLFGNNEITPTHEEYGMYAAKSAALRSSDLSRQVGVAICRPTGEIATLGCNEVPKAGGGTYWDGDESDARDFVQGFDANENHKREVLTDLISRLRDNGHLSVATSSIGAPEEIVKTILGEGGNRKISESRLMDIIEFGRMIHAEMSAISDAARLGVSIKDGILYSTTFPCHLCAKHIVSSGIKKVVFIEPYPKSYASDLQKDSIVVSGSTDKKVSFEPFIGVSPYRYRDLFEKGKRKYSGGIALKWNGGEKRPMIEVYYPSYFEAEAYIVAALQAEMKEFLAARLC
jgi:cytidine deaminase